MSMMNSMCEAVAVRLSGSQTKTSTLTGSAIDLLAYEGMGKFILDAAAATAGTSPTLDVKIQHSDTTTSGDFADLASGGSFVQVTDVSGTAGIQELNLNVSALKRYVRVIGTIGGSNTPTFSFSVGFVGFKKAVNA